VHTKNPSASISARDAPAPIPARRTARRK
jgi:hypothetical protein